MRFAEKIEQFFFPCSKQIKALKQGHHDTMQEFRDASTKIIRTLQKDGDVAANCIIGEEGNCEPEENKRKRV